MAKRLQLDPRLYDTFRASLFRGSPLDWAPSDQHFQLLVSLRARWTEEDYLFSTRCSPLSEGHGHQSIQGQEF
jgi:hypothetical protein